MEKIDLNKYKNIVFFTGAGMSAECGIPTYRGEGGIWDKYRWDQYACQDAFDKNPEKVLEFHEIRRQAILECEPHTGHNIISTIEKKNPENCKIITQNIDGMHQRAGNRKVIELHGSAWHLRCETHGKIEDLGKKYNRLKCKECGKWLRPDIIWFGDALDAFVMQDAINIISNADLFISIGTSGVVWPAAGFPKLAKENNAFCVEINPASSQMTNLYDLHIQEKASVALEKLFDI